MTHEEIPQRLRRVEVEARSTSQNLLRRLLRYRVGPLFRVHKEATHRHLLEKIPEQFRRRLQGLLADCVVRAGGARQDENKRRKESRE